jgi:hypothetical protein
VKGVRGRRRAITWGIVAGLCAGLALLMLDGMWSARSMISGVTSARSSLSSGIESVITGDHGPGGRAFVDAIEDSEQAIDAAGHPSMRLARLLPWIGDNVDGVVAVAEAERRSAEAGLILVDAAIALRWNDLRLPTIDGLGRIDLEAVGEAAPLLRGVEEALGIALEQLASADSSRLVGPVATGYDDAIEALTRRTELAGDAAGLAELVPPMFGGSEPRRYLVAVQRLGQPFPMGGRVGPVGILNAAAGVLSLQPLQPAGKAFASATVSPDGPTTSRALLAAAEVAGFGTLDGVILTDSVGIQGLLWMVGDVAAASGPIRFQTAITALERTPYLVTDPLLGDDDQAALASDVLGAVLERSPSTEAFAQSTSRLVAGRHLVLYSTRSEERRTIRGIGAGGAFVPGDNPLAFTATMAANNRAGTFTRWVTTSVIALDADGAAQVRTTVELRNRAPSEPASALLGPQFAAEPVGWFGAQVRIALPAGVEGLASETSTPSETEVVADERGSAVLGELSARSRAAMTLLVTYRRPGAVVRADDVSTYTLRLIPQPLAVDAAVRIRILLPEGATLVAASHEFEQGVQLVRYGGTPNGPLTLFVSYR